MKTRLARAGLDVALTIDPAILEELGIDDTTEVDVSAEGGVLIIRPIRDSSEEESFLRAVSKVEERYAGLFRRLAKE